MANTLYEYYQSKGQALPTWQQRVPIAQQFGIQNYTGTAEQNALLLAKLQQQGTPAGPMGSVAPQTPQFPNLSPGTPEYLETKARIDALLGQVKDLQLQKEKAGAYETGLGKIGEEIPPEVLQPGITSIEAQREGRITNLEAGAFAPPTKTYDEIYKQAYEQSGLANIQTSITAKDAEISRAKEALINEEGKITENPWLTETGRVGRIRTLYEMAEPQIARLVAERGQLQDQLTTGTSQAEQVATRTQAEELAGRQLKQQELDYLLKAKASETPDKGTPQLKSSASGELIWLYPDGTSVSTGVMEAGKEKAIPTSYREWELAGKPGTYADWISKTATTKPPTASQYQVATYADRIKQAEDIFTSLSDYINNISAFELIKQQKLPNTLRSNEYQLLDQAQRSFINAVLRRESGAAIAESEFENARKQYFVQPGDSSGVIAQKKRNRETVMAGFIREAGSAYTSTEMNEDLRDVVISMGYDYDSMKQDYTDEEIKQALGL